MDRIFKVRNEALCGRCGSPRHTDSFCPLTYEGLHRCRRHNKRHQPFVAPFESWVDFPVICLECGGNPPLPMSLIQEGIAAAKSGYWTDVNGALGIINPHPLGPGTGQRVEIFKGERTKRGCSGCRPRYLETRISWACPNGECLSKNVYWVPDETLPKRRLYDTDHRTSIWGFRRCGALLAPEPAGMKHRKRFFRAVEVARLCPLLRSPQLVIPA